MTEQEQPLGEVLAAALADAAARPTPAVNQWRNDQRPTEYRKPAKVSIAQLAKNDDMAAYIKARRNGRR